MLRAFVTLYRAGLIYKDKRLVNWDTKLQTAVSDLEVQQTEVRGHLWHLAYPIEGTDGATITVATTRPETMLGDTGIAVHPDDERYRHLHGRHAVLPLVGRRLRIVADPYSDPEKGTGAVKITPAHDFNDFEVGRRHGLEAIGVIDLEGRINENAPEPYRGLDRFEARKRVVADLEAQGVLVKIEPHLHTVPHGDRSGDAARAAADRPVVLRRQDLGAGSDRGGRGRADTASCPPSGRPPTSSGCATSSPGASRASSGGATRSPPGTGRTAPCSSPRARPRRTASPAATTAARARR